MALLADLADFHGRLRQREPAGGVLLAPEQERLGADGAAESLHASRARRLEVELLGTRGIAWPRGPGGVGFGEKLRAAGLGHRGHRLDGPGLVQGVRAARDQEQGDPPHGRSAPSAVASTGTNPESCAPARAARPCSDFESRSNACKSTRARLMSSRPVTVESSALGTGAEVCSVCSFAAKGSFCSAAACA